MVGQEKNDCYSNRLWYNAVDEHRSIRQEIGYFNLKKGHILNSPQFNERRSFCRFHCANPVRFQFKDPKRFGGTLSCDLSEGGLRLHMSDFVPLNTEITLQIQLADESIVECPCRVAWVEKNRFSDRYQAGLEFIESGSILDSKKKIRGFLSHSMQL